MSGAYEFHYYNSDSSYSSRSSSPSSDDSFVSSDGEQVDAGPAATSLDLRDAYFSDAQMPPDQPSTFGRTFLRKQETAYAHASASENVLPLPSRRAHCSDTRDQHGLAEDRREVVGYLVDPASGQPVAEWVEERPPPPNKNYSHWHKQGGGLLSRALGYDPHVEHSKVEVGGITNPADPINGDAQLSSTRIAEVSERQDVATWSSRSHVQQFAEQDAGRDQYDGLNPRLSAPERVLSKLEHSWRETQPPPQAPALPSLNNSVGDTPVHAAHSTKRREVGDAFARRPAVGRQVTRLDSVMDIPLATAVKTEREGEGGEAAFASSATAMRAVAVGDAGRPERAAEQLHDAPRVDVAVTQQGAVRSAAPDHVEGRREGEGGELAQAQASTHAPQPPEAASCAEREGGEDAELQRIEAARAERLGHASMPHEGQREGCDPPALHRAADAAGGGDVAPVMHTQQVRLRADARANAISPQAMLQSLGKIVHASACVGGTDARRVNTATRAEGHVASNAPHARCTDQPTPKRADHTAPIPMRAHVSLGAASVSIGEDRWPFDDEATFVYGGSQSAVGAPRTAVTSEADGRCVDRALELRRGNAGGGAHTVAAQPRASPAPSRAQSGSVLGPERLTAHHVGYERRIDASVSLNEERCTPVRALSAKDVPLNQPRYRSEVGWSGGRETAPSRGSVPSPALLRG